VKGPQVQERDLTIMLGRLADGWESLPEADLKDMISVATSTNQAQPVTAPPRLPRLRSPAVVIPAAAAFLALAVILAALVVRPAPAAAGVRFSTHGGAIVATVTNPFASSDQLRRAFAEQRLNIDLKLVPASPSLVGTVVATEQSGSGIEALQGGSCVTGGGGCPVGLRIPLHYQGHAEITLGRPARARERFVASADAFASGEPLHCSGLVGATVSQASDALESRGLSATWRPYRDSANTRLDPLAVGGQFVIDADSMAPDQVVVWVSPSPLHDLRYPALERILKGLSSDC
jgi:hypothetical protein